MTMTVETRLRLIAAAQRGLAWRRERIMYARLTVMCIAESWGWPVDWHSLFDCDRHRHHPLDAKWVGPFSMEDAIVDTAAPPASPPGEGTPADDIEHDEGGSGCCARGFCGPERQARFAPGEGAR